MTDFHTELTAVDNRRLNPSRNPDLAEVIDRRRRNLLKGGLALAAMSFLGGCMRLPGRASPLGFRPVPAQHSADFDSVLVPPGYRAQPFFSWGDPVAADAPAWQPDAGDDWRAQLLQAGQGHDGMRFFPLPQDPAGHGLLVINHEFISPTLHPNGFTAIEGVRPLDEVRKEQAAHGVSVIEVRRRGGEWQRIHPSSYNRRITGLTPMRVAGPLAGHALVRTASDPSGREVLGTLNNCAMGWTPWGTYLTCEENWHNYFVNGDADDHARRVAHHRYGVGRGGRSAYFGWESADPRFDATPRPDQPHGGHVNEPNRFGWVVEINPFDPAAQPVKRTAFGRFCREGATLSLAPDGRMAWYSGDDSRGEYVYKFVPAGRFDPAAGAANSDLLDQGTLYVARFDDDGSGEWLALVPGRHGLTPDNGFPDLATILVNARAAADRAGATPMDRPEWLAVHPDHREVYLTLTNNADRRPDQVDGPNPRPGNLHGQILRWREQGDDPGATRFQWDLFLLAGEAPGSGAPDHLTGTINGDIFSSPDSLAFDGAGHLWIATDYDDEGPAMASMGCNQLLCADPASREVRRFLVGPRGCEITGITFNGDHTALWINVQHPGLSYPASDSHSRPRCTTVLVTREDGGVIGG